MSALSLRVLLPLAIETVRAPRPVMARLKELNLPQEALWQALVLVVVLSALLAEASNLAMHAAGMNVTTTEGEVAAVMVVSPIAFGVLQMVALVAMVVAIFWVGRRMGGGGSLSDSIAAVAWLQFVMVCLQVLQSAAILVAPTLAGVIVIGGLVLFLWLLTNFVAEIHGFRSLGKVFAMILFVMLGVALVLSFVLTLSGVTVPR